MNIEQILRNPQTRNWVSDDEDSDAALLVEIRERYAAEGDEARAKHWALLEMIYRAQNNYLQVFRLFADHNYYHAWCLLERIEISIAMILRHYIFVNDEYKILFIKEYVAKLQKLFPYRLFASSEYVKKEVRCSICNALISLRNRCTHKKGEFYGGQLCSYHITKSEMLAIALVEKPFNKYAVANVTGKNDDNYKYPNLEFLLTIVDHPFNEWYTKEYKIFEDHAKHVTGRNNDCPCGSKSKYKKCCLKKAGVEIDHTEFILLRPTMKSMSNDIAHKRKIRLLS